MRIWPFFFPLFLVGCIDSGDDGSNNNGAGTPTTAHVPEITELVLSPDTATYMEGGGRIVITAEVTFHDAGSDLWALGMRMPGGSTTLLRESFATETGTFTETIDFPTNQIAAFPIEVWLVDQAGYSSIPVTEEVRIVADVQTGDWTRRLSGFEGLLVDVVWNGSVFIAVGDHGAVFTSADGINWVANDSGTDAGLNAVAADGPLVVAVGWDDAADSGIILQSTDHGASWTVTGRPPEAVLRAVAISPSQIVVGGHRIEWSTANALVSEDRGNTWQEVDSWPDEDLLVHDLIYRAGIFIAATNGFLGEVAVSSDGKTWNAVEVSDEWAVLRTIIHDGSQFIAAGSWGEVFTSTDGINWSQLDTPVLDVSYTGAAWNGSRLMLAGQSMCLMILCDPQYVPVGLSSSDGGATWEMFNIGADYESINLAWGNGRFVSVGEEPGFQGEGAIYTAD